MRYFSSIALLAAALLFKPMLATPIAGVASARRGDQALNDKSYVVISGDHLVRRDGQRVQLHGVNLGGWLVLEDWMCGLDDSLDTVAHNGAAGIAGRSAQDNLEARFGAAQAAALMDIWQDHWITRQDLDRIHDSGFNLIRVPISYRTLQHADGSWIRNARGEIDFTRMDWVVRQAAARGMYTVFDLHVWPQQRTDYQKIGRPEGAGIRAAMAVLWTQIAQHYRGNGAIAAFDLINEFPGSWGVQQVLSHAVSQGDPQRVQIVEGFTFAEFIRLQAAGIFPNSIFSDHLYGADPLSIDQMVTRLKPTADSPVPVYIGEFLAADFAAATHAMDETKTNWSSWTYKTVDMGEWGMVNYFRSATTDIENDSYDQIAQKWSTNFDMSPPSPQQPQYSINLNRIYSANSNGSILLK